MKFALISLGCSKNLVDSENFIGILTVDIISKESMRPFSSIDLS